MNPSREELLFQLALSKPATKRAAWLEAECEGDSALRQRLEASRPTLKLDLADVPDEAVGQTLGRCKLLERVGEGGCGVVYVAEQTELVRRRVAMMDHPNIAKVLDAGMTLGAPASRRRVREEGEKVEEGAGETPALPGLTYE